MRIKYGVIYGLIATVGVAVGLKLPDMVFDSMDQKSMARPALYKTSAVQFQQEADTSLMDYLRLAGSQISWQKIDPQSARSTPESVYEKAVEALRLFVSYEQSAGVPEEFIRQQQHFLEMVETRDNTGKGYDASDEFHQELPLVAIGTLSDNGNAHGESGASTDDEWESKQMAVILWRCMLLDEDNNRIVLVVDDVTGKVLTIEIYYNIHRELLDAEALYEVSLCLPNALNGFFSDYYELDTSKMRYVPYPEQGGGNNTSMLAETEADIPGIMAIAEAETDDGVDDVTVETDSTGRIRFFLTCVDAGGDELSIPVTLDSMKFSLNAAFSEE